MDLKAADELMSDTTSKLDDALSATAVNKQTVNVATIMLDTAKTKRDQAMQSLEKIGRKRKLLSDKQHKLLERAMSSTANATQKKSDNSIVLGFLVVDVQKSRLAFVVRNTYIW